MTKIEELEMAITSLPEEEYRQLRQWLLDRDWEKWDREIEADSESGKLDFLLREAMDQSIIVKYRWSSDDMIQCYRYQLRHIFRPVVRFGLHCVFAILLLGGVGGLLTYPKPNGTSVAVQAGCIIASVYWFAFRPFHFRWTVRRQFAKRPDKDSEMEWQIAPDMISIRSSRVYCELNWEALVKIVQAPSGLLLFSLEQVYHYLPRRGFASETEFEQVAELAKSRVQRFFHVT